MSIKQVGFFHFGGRTKQDPIGSLEVEIAKRPKLQLLDTLLVLPEAFNALGGYYSSTPALDPDAIRRLQIISTEFGIVFVAAFVDKIRGPISAYLFDGEATQELLTRKRTDGWRCLYTGSETKRRPVHRIPRRRHWRSYL